MLKVNRIEKKNLGDKESLTPVILELEGDIDQTTVFVGLFSPIVPKFTVSCEKVSAINSIGVKEWINFFTLLRKEGKVIRFEKCAPALVFQMSLFSNFIPLKEVQSIMIPFSCIKCKRELMVCQTVDELRESKLALPTVKCDKCGSPTEFDDIAEEYFNFLLPTL